MQDCTFTISMPKTSGPHKPAVASTRLKQKHWELLEAKLKRDGKTLAEYLRDLIVSDLETKHQK